MQTLKCFNCEGLCHLQNNTLLQMTKIFTVEMPHSSHCNTTALFLYVCVSLKNCLPSIPCTTAQHNTTAQQQDTALHRTSTFTTTLCSDLRSQRQTGHSLLRSVQTNYRVPSARSDATPATAAFCVPVTRQLKASNSDSMQKSST